MAIVSKRKKRRRVATKSQEEGKHRQAAEKKESKPGDLSESMIDETIAESFPASDPPSWTTGREKNVEPSESATDELASLSMDRLHEKARALRVAGRDTMNKDQLIRGIRTRLSGSEV